MTVISGKSGESGRQSVLALRLLGELFRSIGWHYSFFVGGVIAFGLSALLPAQLFRYFTVAVPSLSHVSVSPFLLRFLALGLSIGAILFLSSLGSTLYQEWFRLRLESRLRRRVLKKLHVLPMAALDGTQRGDWLMRMSGDLGRVEMFLGDTIPGQIRNIAILSGSTILFLTCSGTFAFIPIVAACFLGAINFFVQKKLSPVLMELRSLHGGVFQMLIESLEGLRTIRTHRAESYIERRFERKLGEITTKSMKVVRSLGSLMGGTELGSQLMIVGCLTAAAYALSNGQLTVEQILIYPFFLGLFYHSAQSLAASTYDWNRFFVEGARLGELLYKENSVINDGNSHSPEQMIALSSKGLEIGYKGKRLVPPFDFEVTRGELAVVMGPSGCGKSTLLEVLAGLRPAVGGHSEMCGGDGCIHWNCVCRSYFPVGTCAYVEQSPYIFEGSLRENLIFGENRFGDGHLWDALERVGLDKFAHVNGGLDYFLEDRGRNLSQGERYRIALGRALLLSRSFLLVDEPFAALDEISADIVVHALNEEKKRAGVVVVSHLIPPLLSADQKFVFTKAGVIRQSILNERTSFPKAFSEVEMSLT
ncbi:MAG: ABC transporter ATP-binding protein [Deltaproteobacteria bacterium]|nr:ABC transporter ATP-binding protein [Deltaproteobacteria bacterium]